MSELRYLTPAREEFLHALAYYEAEAPGLGAEFLEQLQAAESLILSNPRIGVVVERDLRRVLLQRFPFYLLYSIEPDGHIVVTALGHQRQEPGYWRWRTE